MGLKPPRIPLMPPTSSNMGYRPLPPPPRRKSSVVTYINPDRIEVGFNATPAQIEAMRTAAENLKPGDGFIYPCIVSFATCDYCGSKHFASITRCTQCGAPLELV